MRSKRTLPRELSDDILSEKYIVEGIDRVDLQRVVLILGLARVDDYAVDAGAKSRCEFQTLDRHRQQCIQWHVPETLEQHLPIARRLSISTHTTIILYIQRTTRHTFNVASLLALDEWLGSSKNIGGL